MDTFSAAHRLEEFRGGCENLHGHNYRIEVTVAGEDLDPQGVVMDFRELKGLLKDVLDGLDHQYLNDLPAFSSTPPSAENIALHIHAALAPAIKPPLRVDEVVVWESDTSCVTYLP